MTIIQLLFKITFKNKNTSDHLIQIRQNKDNQLNFDNHVSTLCKKAGSQLNAIGRLRKYISFPEKKGFNRSLCIFKS